MGGIGEGKEREEGGQREGKERGGRVTNTKGVERETGGKEMERERGREGGSCLLYTSPSPRDVHKSRMPSSA